MRILRSAELQQLEAPGPTWVRGPEQDSDLDVALVHFQPGGVTPPHMHRGGQVLVAVSGSGFVRVDNDVTVLQPGDVLYAPAGEWHVHGASAESAFSHLSVTTGRHEVGTDDA